MDTIFHSVPSLRNNYDLCYELFNLKQMRQVEIHAGYYEPCRVIAATGLPVLAKAVEGYSWSELKQWLSEPGVAVIVDSVPGHSVLAFGTGETSEGKYRHALIGRVSGGQSPCSWTPWSEADAHPDEDFWSADCDLGGNSQIVPLYLQQLSRHGTRALQGAIIVKRTEPFEYSQRNHSAPPWWLQSPELLCNSCLLHKKPGDSIEHVKERKFWLNK